jgi:putative Mg2+ transporter-C (MgtC) family protein
MNPTQIAAGVVSGIGFLCGGVIIQRGGSVQGLTTAAYYRSCSSPR